MKEGKLQLTLQNNKGRGNLKELNHKRILWTTSCSLIRKIKFTNSYQKELQEEIENLNKLIKSKETELGNITFFHKEKSKPRWFHWYTLPNIYRRNNNNPLQTHSVSKWGNNSQVILWGQ